MAEPSPYLQGNFRPTDIEGVDESLSVIGELPRELEGIFVRNGSNPRFAPPGRYHWFDGDGMIHSVEFREGKARYRNRWVRTRAFELESEAGRALWRGLEERPDPASPYGPLKDTSNTDLVYHAGQLLSLWWLGGEAYRVRLPDLETCGSESFGGRMRTISAHPKVDMITGELCLFDYKPMPPYLTYGVVSPRGELVHHTTVDLPGPRLQHDLAITEHYTLVFDMSMMFDPEELKKGRQKAGFFRDKPTRIGVLPRYAHGKDVRWFDAEPCFMYHTINAWEEADGTRITLVGCRIRDPLARGDEPTIPRIGHLRLEPCLHRWTLDLERGTVKEEQLDDLLSEFPRMDNRRLGRRTRYSYNQRFARSGALSFDGVVKYDTDTGQSKVHPWPKGTHGGETVFAPRAGASGEDDGWLITFVVDEESGASEVHVLDARHVENEPVARVRIPRRVPTGYHAYWVSAEELASQRTML
jgi:carotenoid cleavage dioxygenase-like enzyme